MSITTLEPKTHTVRKEEPKDAAEALNQMREETPDIGHIPSGLGIDTVTGEDTRGRPERLVDGRLDYYAVKGPAKSTQPYNELRPENLIPNNEDEEEQKKFDDFMKAGNKGMGSLERNSRDEMASYGTMNSPRGAIETTQESGEEKPSPAVKIMGQTVVANGLELNKVN